MSLSERLISEMKSAAKAKDKLRLSTIRMIRASIKNREIDKKGELDDREIIEVLSTLAKQRKDSISHFLAGKRDDLARKEESELSIVLSFLPEQLSREEIEKKVQEAIQAIGATTKKDTGKVMKALMADLVGRADGKVVSEIVQEKLSH